MRIAFAGPIYPYRGGIAHHTALLYKALVERGHEVLLLSFKRLYPKWIFPGESDKDPSLEHHKADEVNYALDTLNPFSWFRTFYTIYRYAPDLIILQWWTPFLAPLWFFWGLFNRLILHRPLVFICHNVLPHEARWWDRWLARSVLSWGDGFTVSSESERELLIAFLPGVRVVVAPLPVFRLPTHVPPQHVAREQLGIPLNVPVLLFFGIVREYKGLEDLLMAMSEIRSRFTNAILLVAGEFWENRRIYEDMVAQLGIRDGIIFDDRYIPNEEVALYFSAADVLVAPYRRVTGSAVVQLAKSFGIPVVTTFDAGVDDSSNLVPAADAEALAQALIVFFEKGQDVEFDRSNHSAEESFMWSDLVCVLEQLSVRE